MFDIGKIKGGRKKESSIDFGGVGDDGGVWFGA